MNKEGVIERIGREMVMPVIRSGDSVEAAEVCDAVLAGGIGVLEITMTVPDAPRQIKRFAEHENEPLVGAGTVLDVETARKCVNSGAAFIVSPVFDREVVRFCNDAGVIVIAGGMTPTEVFDADRSGADAVKVFPASAVGGSRYVAALRSVFPDIRLIPTGGVGVGNATEFLSAGALAVGIGSDLTKGSAEDIRSACETLKSDLAAFGR